jgi:TetR/AcrR family transcriptional repressor of nem operon
LSTYQKVGIFAGIILSTRDTIIKLGDELIRDKGYNAFSFYDIAKNLGIRNASIHYYFPTKEDLVISIIRHQQQLLDELMLSVNNKSPLRKLNAYFSIYDTACAQNRVCLVGSLATDLHTVDLPVRAELKILVDNIIHWVSSILVEGRKDGSFYFEESGRTKALMIVTNMLAAVQLARITGEKDFQQIKSTILKDLKKQS